MLDKTKADVPKFIVPTTFVTNDPYYQQKKKKKDTHTDSMASSWRGKDTEKKKCLKGYGDL